MTEVGPTLLSTPDLRSADAGKRPEQGDTLGAKVPDESTPSEEGRRIFAAPSEEERVLERAVACYFADLGAGLPTGFFSQFCLHKGGGDKSPKHAFLFLALSYGCYWMLLSDFSRYFSLDVLQDQDNAEEW